MDPGTTGNFELTKFDDAALSGEGKAIWSKQEKGSFPMSNEGEMSVICEALK
jgi:predicted Rdx family selenoprotein